jgi:hypothetical protein
MKSNFIKQRKEIFILRFFCAIKIFLKKNKQLNLLLNIENERFIHFQHSGVEK